MSSIQVQADRHRELASIGAGKAADALAKLFDCTVLMQPPQCFQVEVGQLPESMIYQQDWAAAIFAGLVGPISGQAGVMLSQSVVNEIVQRLVGEDPKDGISPRAESALRELGNILISQAAGALGEVMGGIVMPSTPRLGFDLTESLLRQELARQGQHPAFLAEVELAEREGGLRLRFVWIPAA